MLIPGVLYVIVNFTIVKITGNPIYPILPWTSFTSFLIAGGIGVFYAVSFVVYWMVTKWRYKDKMAF